MEDPPAPAEAPANGASAPTTAAAASGETLVPCPSKRQRRPSVRLGDPGEQPAAVIPSLDSFSRRPRPPPHLQWRHHAPYSRDPSRPPSKTRPLIHLHAPTEEDAHAPAPAFAPSDDRSALLPVDENFEPLASAFRRTGAARPKKPKRVRSGWALPPSKIDELADATAATDHKFCGEDGFREGSESPSDNRGYMGPTTEPADGDAPSETDGDGHNWNNKNDYGWCRSVEDGGVRSWLNGLGLARYAPVFEIHEVDDEVLPLLTLEDLKDMGINAVGSRRKMYCAIQKLRKSLA